MTEEIKKVPTDILQIVSDCLEEDKTGSFMRLSYDKGKIVVDVEVLILTVKNTETGKTLQFHKAAGKYVQDGATVH